MNGREGIILIAGYIRGLASRTNTPIDPMIISTLINLGCPKEFLPEIKEEPNKPFPPGASPGVPGLLR